MYQTKAGSCYSQWFCKGFTQNCHPELVSGSHPCFLRSLREKVSAGRMRGYKNKVILDLIQDLTTVVKAVRFRIKYGMTSLFNKGFTLIELLVAIMIIGILAAVAVPQYQKAVMKSRFAAMMPIAKTLANANEVYYAEHDEYSTDPAKLNVTPQAGTPDGTAINMYSNPEEVSFVRVENPGVPNARYVVYQKLSENFPETTWCEAGDTRTEELCVALGGTLPDGLTGNSSGDNTNYKAYLLTGQARAGDSFAETGTETEPATPTCEGVSCDEQGNITECASGLTLNNGACVTCDIPNATSCSTTSYAATACGEGYNLTNGACDPTIQTKVNAVLASSTCTGDYAGYCHDNGDGTISRCFPGKSTYDAQNHKCLPNYTTSSGFFYETLYNADGKQVEKHYCWTTSTSGSKCYGRGTYTYDPATGNPVSIKSRNCQTDVVMDENFNCANGGTYYNGYDRSYSPTTEKIIAEYTCTFNSDCSTYYGMMEWNDTRTQQRTCKTRNNKNGCDEWNDWVSGDYN